MPNETALPPKPGAADAEHYARTAYDSKERFASYWHQIDEIRRLQPDGLLEIGKGNGFFSTYCRAHGIAVTTLDVDRSVHPDLVGSATCIPCADASFDAVAAFQILEHLPYAEFPRALRELRRVARRHVVISLPDSTRTWRYMVHVPKLGEFSFMLRNPLRKPMTGVVSDQHFWEIGQEGHPVGRIRREIEDAGLVILRQYRVFELPYHRFFVLTKAAP